MFSFIIFTIFSNSEVFSPTNKGKQIIREAIDSDISISFPCTKGIVFNDG
jgi:hypothetical protein